MYTHNFNTGDTSTRHIPVLLNVLFFGLIPQFHRVVLLLHVNNPLSIIQGIRACF